MNIYLVIKAIHLLAVVAFLGNISTGLFWMKIAVKTGNPAIIRHTVSGINASDRWFTIPGVLVITAAGFGAAIHGGLPLLRTGWIFWPIILFTMSGIFFGTRVAPLQSKMLRLLDGRDFEKERFTELLKKWEFWGFMALITPITSFFMMILKWPVKSPVT